MKIVIEGMDGVGKSTVAQIIADRIGAKYVDGLLMNYLYEQGMSKEEVKAVRRAIDLCTDNENSIVRTWLYGFANIFNLFHYDCDLVIDRHCLTTFYYNGDNDSQEVFKYMQKLAGKPDLIIILRASIATRKRRISKRNAADPDLLSDAKMEYGYDKLEAAAKLLNLDYVIIDTDEKEISRIVNEAVDVIESRR